MSRALENRNAIITGAGQGLGLAIARAYVQAGAGVLICARNTESVEDARRQLAAIAGPSQKVVAMTADVSRKEDTDRLAEYAFREFSQLHIVVNNAGVYGPKGLIEDVDWEEWVQALAINLLGSILMCRAVLPHMKSHRYGKIIQLSGGGATRPLPMISAYAASKAAVVRFAETLAEEVRGDHIDVNSVAPGALNTRLLEEILQAGPGTVGPSFYEQAVKQKQTGGTPLDRGAALSVFLGSAASDGITGKLISAAWDPWETFPERLKDLAGTDVCTLRRIEPKDRGMNWAENKKP